MINKDLEEVYLYINHAPRNPNLNGIYYDEESYKKALDKYYKEIIEPGSANVQYEYPQNRDSDDIIAFPFIGKIVKFYDDIVVIKPYIDTTIDIKSIRNNSFDYRFGFTFEAEIKDNVAYISEIKSAHIFKAPQLKYLEIEVN